MPVVSVCISNLGSLPLGPTVDIFSLPLPGFSVVDALYTNIQLSGLTGSSCPYNITVPDGTTTVRIRDPLTTCSVDLPVQSNDICLNCSFGFTGNSTPVPGRIVIGDLTTTCQSPISDYRIYWYGPNSTTNLAYTSGRGTRFSPYQFTHPLTGSEAIFAAQGVYKPVVDKIRINNINFSQTATTGMVLAELDCLGNYTVSAITCGGGVNTQTAYPLVNYTHEYRFSNATPFEPPKPLSATIQISPSTTHLAFVFRGYSVNDIFRVSFVGDNYAVPIVLENVSVGGQFGTNYTPSASTKVAGSGENVQKVITLTGFTRSANDVINVEITPSTSVNQTNWDFYFRCLTGFSDNICYDPLNTPQEKIIASSVTGFTGDCSIQPSFILSGCSLNDLRNTDIGRYLINFAAGVWANERKLTQRWFNYNLLGCSNGRTQIATVCSTSGNSRYDYRKYINPTTGVGEIEFLFTNIIDYNFYLNSFNERKNQFMTNVPGDVNSPTSLKYWSFMFLIIQRSAATPSNPNAGCGDGLTSSTFFLHPTATATTFFPSTGVTGLTFNMPLITGATPTFATELGTDNSVRAIAVQPDGKIIIGGDFTTYNGSNIYNISSQANFILRLNSDGDIDSTFLPSSAANGRVNTIVLQPDNKILIGGSFTSYDGNLINGVARLNSDGTFDNTFNTGNIGVNSGATINTISLQNDGNIIIGGSFTGYNGTSINRIARLSSGGTLDTTFSAGTGANGEVFTTAIQSDGKILVGGGFTSYSGITTNRMMRLNSNGSRDTSFQYSVTNPGANLDVRTITIQPSDGKIIVGGSFTAYNNISANRLTRLETNGTIDTSFTALTNTINNTVLTSAVQSDGKILIGGNFCCVTTPTYPIQQWDNIVRLNSNGTFDTNVSLAGTTDRWGPGRGWPTFAIRSIVLDASQNILVGGDFVTYYNNDRFRIVRLDNFLDLDTTFNEGCTACPLRQLAYYRDNVNNSSTGTSNNLSGFTNTGLKYTQPFFVYDVLTTGATNINNNQFIHGRDVSLPAWSFNTYSFTGNPLTYVPSLSGTAAPFSNYFYSNGFGTTAPFGNVSRYFGLYLVRRPLAFDGQPYFEISGSPINNFIFSGGTTANTSTSLAIYERIATWSAGTLNIIKPGYFV
jgi:uncharacterized delta-60 repeat protein